MKVEQIANRLVELCRQGDFDTCYAELYAPDIESVEPAWANQPTAKGFDQLAEKGKAWRDSLEEFHSSEIGQPIVAGNHFAVPWTSKLTFKGAPGPTEFSEICLYEVKDGKIVREQFFYENPEMQ